MMIRIGDKVQVVKIAEYAKELIGQVGVVVRMNPFSYFEIDVKFKDDKVFSFAEAELTKINDDHWGEGV